MSWMRLVAVVTVVVASAGESAAQGEVFFDPQETYRVPIDGAPVLGRADAPVTVVEFSDFYCGFCRRANATLRQLIQLYPGQIRLVFMHSPLDPDEGTLAAEASLAAAAQGLFWPMHDRIFAGPRGASRKQIEIYAAELGLDLVQFRTDLDERRQLSQLRKQIGVAQALGVRSTPSFFINGRPVLGARGLGVFANVIEGELERARAIVDAGVAEKNLYQAILNSGKERGSALPNEGRPPLKIEDGQRYQVGLGQQSHRRGRDDALVTLVEFSDLQCPYCRKAAPIVDRMRAKYGADLRVVYRHFPLAFHGQAQLAAEAAIEAGRQGKFWAYHDRLLGNQEALDPADLEDYAMALGLDMKSFRKALYDRAHNSVVVEDFAAGSKLGISGTPSFFINGVALVGAQPEAKFVELIDREMARARAMVAAGVKRSELYERSMASPIDVSSSAAGQPSLDDTDYHIAVLVACNNGDAAQAKDLFRRIKSPSRRQLLREGCKEIGVDLPR